VVYYFGILRSISSVKKFLVMRLTGSGYFCTNLEFGGGNAKCGTSWGGWGWR